jgi:hypothetical protein
MKVEKPVRELNKKNGTLENEAVCVRDNNHQIMIVE